MRLVREQDDPWRPLHDLVERHARIPGVARACRPGHRLSHVRGQRIQTLALRKYVLTPAKAQRIAHVRLAVDRHQRIHPDGHERAQQSPLAERSFCFPDRRIAAAQQIARVHLQHLRQPAQVGQPFRHGLGKRHEEWQPELGDLLEVRARILFLVGEDQLGLQPRHRLHIGVLGAADHGHRLGRVAVSRSPDEAVAGPQCDHVQGIAGYQRDDAARRTQEDQLALAIVDDPEGGHGTILHSKRRACAPSS